MGELRVTVWPPNGVRKVLDERTIGDIVCAHHPESAAREIVLAAWQAGATDDTTAVVCDPRWGAVDG